MNRTEARQLDCEIRECLENFSIEQGLNPEFGKLIMDNYLEKSHLHTKWETLGWI